jgi:hypothetical protein
MDKIDRLGWAAGIAFRAYGLSVGVRVTDRSVLERVQALLPPAWKPAADARVRRLFSLIVGGPTRRAGVRRFHILYADAVRIVRTHDLEEALRLLDHHLHLYIADRAPRHTFVHAGVVGWNGHAIVIPGRTYTGKSSLVTALVKAGATYYSDEFAVLDGQGRVHPYVIPLAIRPGEGGSPPVKCAVEQIGGVAGTRPLPVGLVLSTRYVNGARFRPRRVSAGRAVLDLLANTLPARRQPERALDALSRITSQAILLRGIRGEAEAAARQILHGGLLLHREHGNSPDRRDDVRRGVAVA